MQNLISKLQQHVQFEIKNYQSLVGNEKISTRRTQDILNIRRILYAPQQDVDFKLKAIKNIVKNFKRVGEFSVQAVRN